MKIRKKLLASLKSGEDTNEKEQSWAVPSFDFMDVHDDNGHPYTITKDNVDDVYFEAIYIDEKLLCHVKHEEEYEWLNEFWQNLRTEEIKG